MNIPSIIYIAGKTCTGKTTLSKQLSDKYQYPIIELDTIVDVLGDEKDHLYIEAYQGDINSPVVRRFIDLTVKKLSEAIRNYHGVIFEGAIANPDILMDNCIINLSTYIRPISTTTTSKYSLDL